jgi:lipoate-protein ligase A
MTLSGRIEGCGKLTFQFRIKKGMIEDATLFGDFFSAGDPQTLAQCFVGYPATAEGLKAAAETADTSCILGLTTKALLEIIAK